MVWTKKRKVMVMDRFKTHRSMDLVNVLIDAALSGIVLQ